MAKDNILCLLDSSPGFIPTCCCLLVRQLHSNLSLTVCYSNIPLLADDDKHLIFITFLPDVLHMST